MSRIPIAGVYAIENTVSGRIYVGSSIHIEVRLAEHRSNLRRSRGLFINSLIHEDCLKYGYESFQTFILERTCDEQDLKNLEILWAERLGAFGPQGYNRYPIHRSKRRDRA